MSNPDLFPQAPSPDAVMWERELQRGESRRIERIARLERGGAVKYFVPSGIARERDGRTDAPVYVWRTTAGEMFAEVQEVSDVRHDAIAVDVGGGHEYVTLKRIDAGVYALDAQRHREATERVEAERAAEQARADEARRNAPQHAVMPRSSVWDAPTFLANVKATAGHLSVHDHRVVLTLPPQPHLIGTEGDYRNAVGTLRPLLVASALGTRAVRCDVPDCQGDAITVGAGGAFLCTTHGH